MFEIRLFFCSEQFLYICEPDAPHGPEPSDDIIVVSGVKIEFFQLDIGFACRNTFQVEWEGRNVPLPAFSVIGMGGRADAQIFFPCPVGTVVPGEIAGAGEIGNLVMEVSGFC